MINKSSLRHAYAGDDPVNSIDLTGQLTWRQVLGSCIIGGGVGALAFIAGPEAGIPAVILGCLIGIEAELLREQGKEAAASYIEDADYAHLWYEIFSS